MSLFETVVWGIAYFLGAIAMFFISLPYVIRYIGGLGVGKVDPRDHYPKDGEFKVGGKY